MILVVKKKILRRRNTPKIVNMEILVITCGLIQIHLNAVDPPLNIGRLFYCYKRSFVVRKKDWLLL